MFPKLTGLGSQHCFFALPVIVVRKYCGNGSLGRADRFDGWTFDTVAGKRFGDELNQTFHRGLLVPQSSWPVRESKTAPAFSV